MIPSTSEPAFTAGLSSLQRFGEEHRVRGRFVALYLGLRRMRRTNRVAELSGIPTPPGQIEAFLDDLFTKTHRIAPFSVLTAPFGQSTSPWSTRTGDTAPGNAYPTNTWRNNLGIQKGVGCPAAPETIDELLADPTIRLACPHRRVDSEGRPLCGVTGTAYRGDEHSIWLRIIDGGYAVVDLDRENVFRPYLFPDGQRIPIFALIAVLYALAPNAVFPSRHTIGIPEFADDFGFSLERVEQLFDCDPDSEGNSPVLAAIDAIVPPTSPLAAEETTDEVSPLPVEPEAVFLNSGVGAELAVARDLADHGWTVSYWGSRRGVGFDLEAKRAEAQLRIEVKSSVGFCTPELTEQEWNAAQEYADGFVLAVVDFVGSPEQTISYLRNPAANVTPAERSVVIYRVLRSDVLPLSTTAEFL